MQCYKPHFKFAINLIKAFYEFSYDFKDFDFIIVVDNKSEETQIKNKINKIFKSNFNNIFIKNIQDIINNPFEFLKYNENFSECDN